jgi:hypothetical protein
MLQQILSRLARAGTTPEPESKSEESPQARYTTVIRGLLKDAYQQNSVLELTNVQALPMTTGLRGWQTSSGGLEAISNGSTKTKPPKQRQRAQSRTG